MLSPSIVIILRLIHVVIGICCKDCVAVISKEPDKYAAAALANKKAAAK